MGEPEIIIKEQLDQLIIKLLRKSIITTSYNGKHVTEQVGRLTKFNYARKLITYLVYCLG